MGQVWSESGASLRRILEDSGACLGKNLETVEGESGERVWGECEASVG